jgi:hypothetical protein
LRPSGRDPRFGLRNVGPYHLADIETIARLLELFGEDFDFAPLQFENRLIAQENRSMAAKSRRYQYLSATSFRPLKESWSS